MNLRAEIQIFPNSGHHFTFVPFPPDHLQAAADIKKLCVDNRSPWLQVSQPGGIPIPWIRARFATQPSGSFEPDQTGLFLAIESNLGNAQRGWILQPRTPLAPTDGSIPNQAQPKASPYAFAEASAIPSAPQNIAIIVREDKELNPPLDIRVDLEISWIAAAAHPIDVDLIIDFGNTRTVAIGLEHNQAANGLLSQICRPIQFSARASLQPFRFIEGAPAHANPSNSLIDSWFILHEPLFAQLESFDETQPHNNTRPPWVEEIESVTTKSGKLFWAKEETRPGFRTLRFPQICAQFSPALLGPEAAQILTQLPIQIGGNFFMSSPKRYLWDKDPVGHLGNVGQSFWTMYLNRWHPDFLRASDRLNPTILPKLSATILRFMNQNGRDWTLGDDNSNLPPNENESIEARPVHNPDQPTYPRGDALTWAALSILEAAYRNITSAGWRRALGQPQVPRRLRAISVTFPPGWTGQELEAYRRKWQKAVDIFTLTHLPNSELVTADGDRPLLLMDLDEAVASQLPLVFSDIKRLGNEGENWIELVGRGSSTEARTRILNIDIGGGTTDIAIIEYHDKFAGPGVQLVSNLIYRDSSTIAGDALVKRAIEAVLLPAIAGRSNLTEQQLRSFDSLLSAVKQDVANWRRITRQIFIPIVYRWLNDLSLNRYYQGQTTSAPTPEEILSIDAGLVMEDFRSLLRSAGLPDHVFQPRAQLHYDQPKLSQCIKETFAEIFYSLAKVVDAFDCDLVYVSGKPSELPPLRPLLEEALPMLPHRIVMSKDAPVGSWYPLSSDGRINDAKTATVAGAALSQAIRSGLIPDWQLSRQVSPHLPKRNYWGLMPQSGRIDFGKVFLEPKDVQKTCSMMIGNRVGRRLLPSKTRPEPVYELRWKDLNRRRAGNGNVNTILEVTLQRVVPETTAVSESTLPTAEYLVIRAVSGTFNDRPVTLNDVELRLCTMDGDDYWMESCIFHGEWPN